MHAPRAIFPDHPNRLPVGSVIDGNSLFRLQKDQADYVIVGSGAAGATAAQFLSKAGFSVILLEEGPWVRTHEFSLDIYPAMKTLFRDTGAQIAHGSAPFPMIQGRCVGGSTTVNSAIAWRVSESIIENWNLASIRYSDLEEHFDALDKALTVQAVSDQSLGNNNSLFGQAADKLGISSQRMRRYDAGCDGSSSCLTGCRTGKKMGMNLSFVPESLHNKAKIYHSTRVHKIDITNKIVQARNLHIQAKKSILLAASAIQSPGILQRSGIKLRTLGKNLQAHPGSSIIARFNRDISMHNGATQGYNSTHFSDSLGFKLETLSLPPELLCMRLPYIGPDLVNRLQDYKKIINWALIVKAEARGQIKTWRGRELIQYSPTSRDMFSMRRGYQVLCEMMFAVGAQEIWPHVHGMPVLKSPDDLNLWDSASLNPQDYSMMASHMFGTCQMGLDSKNSVVDLNFQVHGCPGIYVLDSSIFPSNIGVNPQHTIMAIARLAASRLI